MYTKLAEIPVPIGAQFTTFSGPTVVQATYQVKEHVKNTKRSMSKTFAFSHTPSADRNDQVAFEKGLVKTYLDNASDTILHTISASGLRRAVLRKSGDAGDGRHVEVWKGNLLEASMEVTDLHGDFYADESLGSLAFSPSESSLVYVAEANKTGDEKTETDPFKKFRFNPDFGEGLGGKRSPGIFLFSWSAESTRLTRVETVGYEDVRFGQLIFDPISDPILYATGYEFTMDRRVLGVKGCFNRPSGIWRMVLPPTTEVAISEGKDSKMAVLGTKTVQKLTPSHLSCRSPRTFTQNAQSTLVWLSSATGGAHVATTTLHVLDISSRSEIIEEQSLIASDTPVVDLVKERLNDLSKFPGLYPSYNLPQAPFILSNDGNKKPDVVLHSVWGSRTTILRISLRDGAVEDLTPDPEGKLESWILFATDGRDQLICSRSSLSVPYELLFGQIKGKIVNWYILDQPELSASVSEALSSIKTRIIQIPDRPLVETIVVESTKTKRDQGLPPCITTPHGGPHGTTTTTFTPSTTALALEGYTVSLPNYTGSPGFGEAFLQDLVGRCGELDVQDCIATARYLIAEGISEQGPGKQFITGGSHGGFLTAHLIGQFPDFFSAAALRNPVISVGELATTDIPDWYFAEFGLDYPIFSSPRSFESAPKGTKPLSPPLMNAETYKKLQEFSPMRYFDAIHVPVLLLIGKADRRVAPTQGIEFYHALKAKYAKSGEGVEKKVEMLLFDGEGHPLEGVEASKIVFEAMRDFLAQACG